MSELCAVERLYGAQTSLAVSSVTDGVLGKVRIIYFALSFGYTTPLEPLPP
jgi:hypothetical protein